ncbi:MAG TPA: type II toxin-antitoxin system prevent-host-death family antitoxin [Terriglobales bacterium]|nr:type II toxin-antitoxin system prevent-host-death family antitoxin [Terriglobales bacterium]
MTAKTPTVGSRELKTRLGRYLRLVRQGQTLIVTDRGEPIAELRPLPAAAKESEAEAWERLERAGIVSRARQGPLADFKPLRMRGKPLSQTIIEDREDRF